MPSRTRADYAAPKPRDTGRKGEWAYSHISIYFPRRAHTVREETTSWHILPQNQARRHFPHRYLAPACMQCRHRFRLTPVSPG